MEETNCDCVLSVTDVGKYHPLWMLSINEDTDKIDYYKKTPIYRRQDLPKLFYHDGAIALVKTDIILQHRDRSKGLYNLFGDNIRAVYNEPWDVVDIDNYFDLKLAEVILQERYNVESKNDSRTK
jgi:CMP-N-acetylneuraminic acid synthetase